MSECQTLTNFSPAAIGVLCSGISGNLSSGMVAYFAPEWVAYFVAESWRTMQRNIHIYILINAVLVLGYIPHKGDYKGDVRALTKLHIERFSEEQIYRGHALVCIVITCAWYALNFYFELLPVGTAIWVGFVLFPLLLRISGLRILRRL